MKEYPIPMRTYLDCIPCFFKQALEAARLAGADPRTQRQVLDDVARALPKFSLEATPPEMGRTIHQLVKKNTGLSDPYLAIKEKSNQLALSVYPKLIPKLNQSDNRLLTAVELAITGNIIDYGVKNSMNVDTELEKILSNEKKIIKNEDHRFFQFTRFKEALAHAKTVLYLADNAGETVFDRILIEEMKRMNPAQEIIYVVKEKPIINDALIKDAVDSGIDETARIFSSGSDAPGTILSLCSDAFLKIYYQADLVISKGQGNFEGLSGTNRSVFFLFLAKCPVIANDAGCQVGDVILLAHPENNGEK
jgi:uncharacterized protein with ATP-grasp and redox domains